MKTNTLLIILSLFVLKSYAQVPQTKSVTISPLAGNVEEVKGNIKATGIIESNTLKASGLASGNPYVANPVYANLDGTLVTGYKTGYLSIPPSAFMLADNMYYSRYDLDNGLFHQSYQGTYKEVELSLSSDKVYAPIQIPHKSKLVSMKLNLHAFTPTSIAIFILGYDIDNTETAPTVISFQYFENQSVGTKIFTYNLNLVELDNSKYLYSLQIFNLSYPNENHFSVRGAIIEYQDF